MKRYFGILSLLVVFAVWFGVGSLMAHSGGDDGVPVSLHEASDGDARDRLFDATPVQPKHEATLSGRLDSFHACNERVRRTVPTTGFHSGHVAVRATANSCLAIQLMSREWQCRLSSLPHICLSVRYYVIALRHILR